MREFLRSLAAAPRERTFYRLAMYVVILGALCRLVFWYGYPLYLWKAVQVVHVLEVNLVAYLANFEGYQVLRSPFYPALASVFYVSFEPVLGPRAITLYSLLLSIVALPCSMAPFGGSTPKRSPCSP